MNLRNATTAAASFTLVAVLAACSGANAVRSMPVQPAAGSRASTATSMLYVSSFHFMGGYVNVYPLGQEKPVLRLKAGLDNPSRIVFDAQGNIYVANDITVCEFAPGGKKLIRTLDIGIGTHGDLTIDAGGTAYVGYYLGRASRISIYPPGKEQPSFNITKGVTAPVAVAVDSSGYLYVANLFNPTSVKVYPPGGKTPVRSLDGHFVEPTSLAFDADGNLYVADKGDQQYGVHSKNARVLVYPPGSSKPSRVIHAGIRGPVALKFDSVGNLYVGNVFVDKKPQARGYVAVYAPGASEPTYSTDPVNTYEILLGLDPQNYLYVGHGSSHGAVSIYAPGSSKPSSHITAGIPALQGIEVSP
jgi:hypothetical protein